jgi:zinc/manganese transport system permease protein
MPAQGPSWDVVADVQLLLQFHFMQNALAAGTLVALLAGVAGYFVVVRGQSLSAHMLSQAGFPGAAAAVLVHAPPVAGLVAFCGAAALGAESAAVGSVLALSLALGLVFVRLASAGVQYVYAFLFGSILGITDGDVAVTLATTAGALAVIAATGRPLLFASVDPDVADSRGVPVAALSTIFVVTLALAVAITVQVVGTLLVFALLVAPAAAAVQLTSRPQLAIALSVALALAATWAGMSVAYFTDLPVGFLITTFGFAAYLSARLRTAPA